MQKTAIWKFHLAIINLQTIQMPKGARILSVQAQRNQVCLWAMVNPDPEIPSQTTEIEMHGTGHIFTEGNLKFIGTVLTENGNFVWHVFEVL